MYRMDPLLSVEDSHVDVLHEISVRLGTADGFHEIRMIVTVGFLVGAEVELARLEEANSTLAEQLQTRKIVERAKGILQRDLGLNEEQAYLALQRQSRQKRIPMKEIAEAIVLSDDVRGNSQIQPT